MAETAGSRETASQLALIPILAASAFPIVAALIRWILIAVLLAFAALSLYDYFQLRSGRTDGALLQLPQSSCPC